MSHRRTRASLFAAVVVATGVVAPAVLAVPGAVAAPGTAPAGPTVTLLTGDEVTLGGTRGVHVRAAKGREHVSFLTRQDEEGDTHVIPDDAISLLSSGKLDPRLFDVTELARTGYDNASRDMLPLIVDYPGRTPRVAGAQVSRELPAMSATAVSVERTDTFWATAKNAERVWLDGPVRASLDRSVPQIGAPEAWAAGQTGAGTTVAVLDTGIDVTHPDLADAVVGAENFTDADSADDMFGHGTHVASTITGNNDKYRGVAPDAKLLNGKVLNNDGDGQESWIIAGMEWATAGGADVVNMSLGTEGASDGTDPMSQAVNRLTAQTGVLFVVSAGNTGGMVGSPGAADAALTVGAVDRQDQLADFSSRGHVGSAIKPDITAPGVDIVAAKAKNGRIGTPAGDGYVSLRGTSMAAPHVAGAAAILAGKHPDWTADQLKATLMASAKPTDGLSVFEQGAGRVDVAKAMTTTVAASPASISNGVVQWPHNDDEPITKTLTYTNTGSAPVTLDLAADVTGPDGAVAPQGMFTFTPARVTVPAGGRATTTVTTDTRVGTLDGVYSGVVTATGGGLSVRTPVAVTREAEAYDVTVRFVDRNGAPTGRYLYRFMDVDKRGAMYAQWNPSGTVVMRLPKGEYYVDGAIMTPKGDGEHSAYLVEPAFTVTGATTLVLDAREVEPVSFALDKPNARAGFGMLDVRLENETWNGMGMMAFLGSFDDFGVRPATTSKKDDFSLTVEAHLAEWNGTSFDGSPYLYHVRHTVKDTVPASLNWTYRDRQFAKVRSTHAASAPGMFGVREGMVTMPLPATLTEYYTPDVPWHGYFSEVAEPGGPPVSVLSQVEPRSFPLGRTTTERWNVGVYGPAFPDNPAEYAAVRNGDEVYVNIPLATDQGRGRLGYGMGEGVTTLSRDGQVVGEEPLPGNGLFIVAPDRGRYTLRASVTRAGARLSTVISDEWEFTSERTAADAPAELPLLTTRFAPNLDDHNAAPAGKRFTFPVSVERNGGPAGTVHTPAVEVSYDDGVTWQPATVKRHGTGWQATVTHPRGPEFVSLRSTVTDPDGNVQRQTIIRAYALT